MTAYVSYYPLGWQNFPPSSSTPILAAALQNMETGIALASPSVQGNVLSTSQGSWVATTSVVLLQTVFTAAGRLRLYNSTAARSADQSRAAGVLPTTTGILYEYVADTANSDTAPVPLYVGALKVIYWQLDGGPSVTVTWVQDTQ